MCDVPHVSHDICGFSTSAGPFKVSALSALGREGAPRGRCTWDRQARDYVGRMMAADFVSPQKRSFSLQSPEELVAPETAQNFRLRPCVISLLRRADSRVHNVACFYVMFLHVRP